METATIVLGALAGAAAGVVAGGIAVFLLAPKAVNSYIKFIALEMTQEMLRQAEEREKQTVAEPAKAPVPDAYPTPAWKGRVVN